MSSYRIFTVNGGTVSEDAVVEALHLKGAAGIIIPVIAVGEEGRGRKRDIVAVSGADPGDVIRFAELGTTKVGKPKLIVRAAPDDDSKVIVVFRTPIGFRGGNSHTGDRTGEEEHKEWDEKRTRLTFAPFPGVIISAGMIAEGSAGRMGYGDQLIAVMPENTVFRTAYSGRRYGAPGAHYYVWNGKHLLALTWAEREISELF